VRIGELAQRSGVSQRSLRYYESQGLLACERAPSGQRHYNEGHLERVQLIQSFIAAGVPTRVIAQMTPCMANPSQDAAHRAATALQ